MILKSCPQTGRQCELTGCTGPTCILQPNAAGQDTKGDWQEDFLHENGNYMCTCVECKCIFRGHKRRIVCKSCANAVPAAPTQDALDAARGRWMLDNSEWRRYEADDRDPGYAMLCIRLPYDADLSCKAMRENTIDAAIARSK